MIPNSRYAVASGLDVCEKLILHRASPDGALTVGIGSALCLDIVSQELYILKAAGGSAWFHIGSIS